jgi:hypothetical protein
MCKVTTLSFHTGMAGDRLLGPYFLPPRRTGAIYHDFLCNVLTELLQDVDLHTGIRLWFMHDGAPPHSLLAVREFLNNVLPEQWMGGGRPTAWHSSSSNVNPLHFYAAEVSDVHDLQRVRNGFEMIRTTPGLFQ